MEKEPRGCFSSKRGLIRMKMKKAFKKPAFKVYPLALAQIFVSILIINLFFYGLSQSEEPVAGYITIVKVRMEGSTKRQSIEKVTIQPGVHRGKPLKPDDIMSSIAASDLPQLVLLDTQGRVLYMMEFDYPILMTVPPLPPGEKDDTPSVVPIENPEVTLVLPYFLDARTIQVIAPGETRASDSMPLSDAEFIKKNETDAIPIEPPPSLPGSLNILIMASGYDASSMTNFQSKANSLMETLLITEPFKTYASRISINIYGNTADLGCYAGYLNIDRLMYCDTSKVITAAASSGYYYDEIIVIHNTATYSGGGGRDRNEYKYNSYASYVTLYDGPYTIPMALHEFGHSFGNLCDEYTYTSEGYEYRDCVNCRANCIDWSLYSSTCQSSCDAMQTYYRPEDSIMLSFGFMTYNTPSIMAPYSPDGLEKRIQYFAGTIETAISPSEGTTGTELTITGAGFGTNKGKVLIGSTPLTIIDWAYGLIHCRLTKTLAPGVYDVTIEPGGPKGIPSITKKDAFAVISPEIYSIDPTEGSAYDQVTIRGKLFGPKKGKVYLVYDKDGIIMRKSCKVVKWFMESISNESEIIFVVPKMLPQVCDVVINPAGILPDPEEKGSFTVKAPEIISVEPGSGIVGDPITVSGNFFGCKKGKVYLGYLSKGKPAKKNCSVLSWSDDEIIFVVPKLPLGTYDAYDVIVTNGVSSDILSGGFVIK
jgi:hypothetical protein